MGSMPGGSAGRVSQVGPWDMAGEDSRGAGIVNPRWPGG